MHCIPLKTIAATDNISLDLAFECTERGMQCHVTTTTA